MFAMDAVVSYSAAQILDMVPLTWVTGILDIGGGTGRLSSWICDVHPQCKRYWFALTVIVDKVTDFQTDVPINDRVEFQKGNFRKVIPQLEDGINAVVLSRILHDWDDPTCLDLLKRIHKAFGASTPPAGVIIFDMMFNDDDKVSPTETNLQDCNMLVQTVSVRHVVMWLLSKLTE